MAGATAPAGEFVEILWRGGHFAVVWKVAGVPLTDAAGSCLRYPLDGKTRDNSTDSEEAAAPAASAAAPRGRAAGGGRAPQQSVCAWAVKNLDGKWEPASVLSIAIAGLLVLTRPASPQAPIRGAVRGSYSFLVAPPAGAGSRLAELTAPEVEVLWENLGLFGDMEQEARVIQEVPSGHFGRLALVQADVLLSGPNATAPLRAILALQVCGFRVVLMNGSRGSELRNPQLQCQIESQVDVLPGTCVSVVAIKPPALSNAPPTSNKYPPLKAGRVVHAPPTRFLKLLAAEKALAEQRRQPTDDMVVFRGLKFWAPGEQLRPRPSSSAIVDAILGSLPRRSLTRSRNDAVGGGEDGVQILDLGVGCGALLLSALHALSGRSSGTGVDIDAGAIQACQTNVRGILSAEHATRVQAVLADFSQLDSVTVRPQLAIDGYDIVVCNPPYRSEEQQEAYDRSVGQHGGYKEHSKTLVGGKTGLEMYEAVAACLARDLRSCETQQRGTRLDQTNLASRPILKPAGTLIFQVEAGARGVAGGMAEKVSQAVEAASEGRLKLASVHVDEKGLERAILMKSCA